MVAGTARLIRLMAIAMISTTMAMVTMIQSAAAARDVPNEILVYSISRIPVRVPASLQDRTTIITLDRIGEIESALAEGLDRIPEGHREAAAGARLSGSLQLELKKIGQALARIHQDRITHLPAIVFDGRAVWYGFDLRRALKRYRERAGGEL